MIKRVVIFLAGVLLVGALLMCVFCYRLDFRETVIVTTFGRPSEPIRGATDAGLKFRAPWPIQEVHRFPASLMVVETADTQRATRDDKSLMVTSYCTWRIVDAGKFHRIGKSLEEMRHDLVGRLGSSMADAIGGHLVGDFVNTDPSKMALPAIEQEVLANLREGLLERIGKDRPATTTNAAGEPADSLADLENPYGIEVVTVGIKMLGLPEKVSREVIASMGKERQAEADRLREQGKNRAMAISARAVAAREKILAFAQRRAEGIQSEGYRAVADLYPKFKKHEDFAMFLRALRSLEFELQGNSVFLLDNSLVPGMDFFRNGPRLPSESTAGGVYSMPPAKQPSQEKK